MAVAPPTSSSRPLRESQSSTVTASTIQRARTARPGEFRVRYGTSADAYHLTSGSPDGAGAQVAMNNAIRNAGLTPDDSLTVAALSETGGGIEAGGALLDRSDPPTAIFCFNDRMAAGGQRVSLRREH